MGTRKRTISLDLNNLTATTGTMRRHTCQEGQMETVQVRLTSNKPLTTRERRERFWIKKLERLPCFEQMVKRLVGGKSVSSVARWAQSLEMDGELKNAGLETWRKYINSLSIRIRINLEARPEIKPRDDSAGKITRRISGG